MSRQARLLALASAALAVTVLVAVVSQRERAGSDGPAAGANPPEPWPSIAWLRVADPDLSGPGWDQIEGVSTGPGPIVAWGTFSVPDPGWEGGLRPAGAIWTSADGRGWERHELDLPAAGPLQPFAAAATGGGYLVAGSLVGVAAEPVVLSSRDGTAWVPAPGPPLDSWAALTALDDGFVAAGWAGDRPTVWQTRDGQVWHEMRLPPMEGDVELLDLAVEPAGIVLAGRVERRRDLDAVLLRWTPDAGWQDLAADERTLVGPDRGATISRVVPFAGGLFATGWAGDIPDCVLSVVAVAALSPPIADHCPGLPPALWVSRDGGMWQEVAGPRPRVNILGPIWLEAVAAAGPGVLALVNEAPPGADRARIGIWASGGGIDWARVGDGPPVARDEWIGSEMVGIERGIVAFGSANDGEDIAVWVGTPGN